MDPRVEKVLRLPELREKILKHLLFDKNQGLEITNFKTFRLVCRPWLETVNQCIHQNLRNAKDPFQDWIKYTPVYITIKKLPQFLQLLENDCLKSNPALPFKLFLSCSRINLIKHHKDIENLFNNYSQGLVMIHNSSPCDLTNLYLPNLQVLTTSISSVETSKRLKTIQQLLDGSQHTLHSFRITVMDVLLDNAEPLRLPEQLQKLLLRSNGTSTSYIEMILKTNMKRLPNIQHLKIATSPTMPLSSPELVFEILSNCPSMKSICLTTSGDWYIRSYFPSSKFRLPETLKHLQRVDMLSSWNAEKPKHLCLPSNASRYPKWIELNIVFDSDEQLRLWTSFYSCKNLKQLMVFPERRCRVNGRKTIAGLSILQIEQLHLAYPNISSLDIFVDNQNCLEYIFKEMTNLKFLSVRTLRMVKIAWDAVLIGCSKEEVQKLREDFKIDAKSTSFVPNESIPSIRNMKRLHTLRIISGNKYFYPSSEYCLSDMVFPLAFLQMKNLVNLELTLTNHISDSTEETWTSQPNRSLKIEPLRKLWCGCY